MLVNALYRQEKNWVKPEWNTAYQIAHGNPYLRTPAEILDYEEYQKRKSDSLYKGLLSSPKE